jgi:hypothetical protein
MKKRPKKSILLLLGYLLVLMIVFKVFALKADQYSASKKEDIYSHQSIPLKDEFHHIRIEGNGAHSINIEIQKSTGASELDGYRINQVITYRYSGDTLILTNTLSEDYQSINLLVSHPIESIIARNSLLNMASDILASEKNIYIECTEVDESRTNNARIQFVGNDIQSIQMRLRRCSMHMYPGVQAGQIGSMEFDAKDSDVEFDAQLSGLPMHMIFKTDEQTTLKAPSYVLQRMQLMVQN